MYDSQEITRVSKNLSLRLSPERKYAPKYTSCSVCCCYPCRCCITCHCLPCRCCSTCHCLPCRCCTICHCLPCKCCRHCHCCPCTCFLHSPLRCKANSPLKTYSPYKNKGSNTLKGSTNFSTYHSPARLRTSYTTMNNNKYNYKPYEQKQFNDFLRKLMEIESQIEKIKIDLALNSDFNVEDAFRLFESEGRDYLNKNDLKCGLNLIGIFPTNKELNLLMKRFDLQKQGGINFADFFDIVVPFEKEYRNMVEDRLPNSCCACRCPDIFSCNTICNLKELFNFIICVENEINNIRRSFGTLRIKLRDIFGKLDCLGRGYFTNSDLIVYLLKEDLLTTNKDADLLFIRLDKNRNGKIDYKEVEDELQTLY